jgi:hypothetical protein
MTKTYKTKHPKEKGKQSHCKICNKYVRYIEGYTGYICGKCVELATDKDGKPVIFKTITESGNGVQGVYKDTGKLYRSRICYIKGAKCTVEETNICTTQTSTKPPKGVVKA